MQISYGYGLFTGGLGAHYGAERVGATVLPTSVGNTERQVELMRDLRVTAIACTPSYLIHIGEVAEKGQIVVPGSEFCGWKGTFLAFGIVLISPGKQLVIGILV